MGAQPCGQGQCARVLDTCVNGQTVQVQCDPLLGAVAELCNGLDDDCDGVIDNDPTDIGEPCAVGVGACARQGTIQCDGIGARCDGVPGDPAAELCDQIDNDCDGQTDEGEVCPDVTPPLVALDLDDATVSIGQPVTITVSVTDDRRLGAVTVTVGGQAVQLDQDGQYVFVPQANGDVLVVVVATDEAGNQTREEATIEVRDRRPVAIVDVQPGFIDEGDNHATRVTLDASPSTGGNLTFAWDLPNATVVGGGVDQPTVEVTWSGAVEPQWFLTVRNAQGQDVTAGVVPLNRAPFARIAGDGVVALGQNHTYDGRASEDPNGDPLNYRWTLVQRPEGSQASLGDAAGDQATLLPDLAGRYRLQLEVDDGRLPAEPAIKDVFATSPDLTPPQVQIGFDPVDPQAGQPVLIQVLGNDPAGIATRRLTVDGQDIPLDANGEATFVPPADGRYAVRAEVTDRAGNLTVEEVALFVAAPAAGAAPTVTISAPAEAAGVRQLMEVRGTVSDPDGDLAWYGVALARRGSGIWTTVFEGQDPVNNGPIAQVDVGALAAGMYELRVQASDLQGRTQTALQVIEILPGQSFGGRRMEFLDATVRVAGIPLQIRRIYDSGDKRPGDFGVAWSVDVGVGEVEESNPPYEGWSFQGNCVFNNRIVPTQSHQVTFYIGDEGYRFTFSPTFNGCGLGYQQVVARFLPMPGTDATLQVINDTNTPLLIGNDLFSDDFLEDWRPGYRMTLPDGRVFDFDRDQGATRIDDGAGSRVDITANGLIHSSGVNLSWQRDAAGRITRITLPDGRSRTYTYDGNGDLRRAADFEARVTHFEYDGDHNLLTVIEPDGAAQQSWEYDATGRLIAIVDALGNRRTLGHDGVARQESVVDRTGGETVFLYDEDGNVLEMVDALGNRWVNGYDAAGNRTSITDPLGNVTRFEYDANGRQTARIDANGGRWETAYDADGRVTETRDPLGNVTLIGYDANGFRDRFEDPTGAVTQWSFTADGRVNSITNAEGAQVQYTFDAQGRMTRVVDAGGFATDIVPGPGGAPQVESFAFESTDGVVQAQIRYDLDPDGFIEGVTDTNGARSFLDRSESGQITGFLAPTGQQIDMDLDGVGRIRRQRDPEGRSIGTDYDGEDRLTALTLPGGQQVQKVYDAGGNLVEVIGPTGGRRVQTYDGASRVASIGNGQDIRVDFGYDPAGNLTTTDNQGAVTRFEYDAASRLSAIVDPMGRRTDLERDAAGRITRRVYADQTEERLAWDGNGRQISQQTARGHIWTFGNAPSGMLETVTDPAGGVARFDYDRNGRYNRITDPLGRVTTYAHRPDGRVKARTLPLGQTDQYSYRADGRMDAWTDPAGGVTTYVFDVAARREITRYPDGAERTQTYDELERPVADETAAGRSIITWLTDDQVGSWRDKDGQLVIQQADGGGLPTAALTDLGGVRWHYDNRQFLSEVRAEGGLTVAYGRDLSGLAESAALPGGGTLAWTHDAAGRADTVAYTDGGGLERFAAARTFTQGLLTRVVEDDGRAVDYTYDNLDRVTREVITAVGGGVEAIEYTYDAMGNITQRTDGGGAHALQYDANDRLLDDGAWQYQYDALGRLSERTQGGVTERFTYDGAGHMVGFERLGGQATAVTYAYEHDGLLRSRTEAGVTTRYLWDRGGAHPRLLEERNGDGELVRRYVWGDQLVGYWDAAEQAWHTVVVDQVGTVRLDEGPGGRQRFEFDAYGRRRSAAAPVGLGFASSWTDAASGLVYMQHRWYSPDMMRFAQPDPKPAVAEDPRTLNRYAYAVGNPVHFSDPTGEFGLPSMSVTVAIVGILATGATMFGIGWLTGANSSTGPKNWLQALFMAFTGKLFDDKTCVIWPTVSVSASAGAFSSITAGFDVFHYNGGGPWDGKNALMLTLGLGFEFSAGAAGPGVGVTIAKPIPGIGWNQQTPGHSEGWGLAAGLSSGAIGNLSASASFGVGLGGATFGLGLNPTYKKGEKQLYGLAIVPNMGYTIGTVTGGNGGLLGGASLHLTMTVYMGRLFGWDPN
ncbi:MAG: hypothetical protein KC613_10980 [Myxococcales bacterium]|nr:hypothetical protein [Myxococcales bacterium]